MSYDEEIKRAYIFTSRGDDKVSNAIAWFTSPKSWWLQVHNVPSHTGIMFEKADGTSAYFESHTPEGWKGPHPKSKLENWAAAKPKRWVRYRDLELTEEEGKNLWNSCKEKLLDPEWMDYPEHQIYRMAMSRLFKRHLKNTQGVICSEAVGKLLYPYYDIRLWRGKRPCTFDELTPWWCQVVPLVRRGEEVV